MRKKSQTAAWLALGALLAPPAFANPNDGYISSCLNAWGEHPFGKHPHYQTLSSSVKVFGIGQNIDDLTPTKKPNLVLVDTGVNIMGGSTMQLLNPNGWYCFISNVNVMGGLTIRAHCKAHLASSSNGLTVLGGDPSNKSVTVLGATNVEVVGCNPSAPR
jgi:hypothetical protein